MNRYSGTINLSEASNSYTQIPLSTETVRSLQNVLESLEYNSKTLTPVQIASILGLRWLDNSAVISLQNFELTYELISILLETDNFEMALSNINDLTSRIDPNQFLEPTKLILDLYVFLKEKNEYIADIDRAKNAINLIEGEEQCKKCGSMKTSSVRLQMRAADEPMTVKSVCFACGFRWVTN